MEKNTQCPKGYRWCPITKRCIPEGDDKGKGRRQGKGQGKGPIGQPGGVKMDKVKEYIELFTEKMSKNEMKNKMKGIQQKCSKYKDDKKAHHQCVMQQMKMMIDKKNVKEAAELVDVILTGDYFAYKAIGDVDKILDEVENKIDNIPDQNIEELHDDVVDELSTDSADREEEEMEEYKENTVEENMKTAVQLLVSEEDYRTYFKSMLKKWNINSPSDLDKEKKKEFFNAVDKGWKAKKETD